MASVTSAPHRPHLRATLILACLAQFMVILDVSVVNVALPSIRDHLGFTEQDLQWVVNAYTVTFAGFCCWVAARLTSSVAGACSSAGWCCSRPHRWWAVWPTPRAC